MQPTWFALCSRGNIIYILIVPIIVSSAMMGTGARRRETNTRAIRTRARVVAEANNKKDKGERERYVIVLRHRLYVRTRMSSELCSSRNFTRRDGRGM